MIGTIAYDIFLRRPGCVIIQAGLGCTINVAKEFPDSDVWLLAPTPDMRIYPVENERQLDQLKRITAMAHELRRMEK